ncbi:hypothetical protein [Microseira sp. BLCC-F43]|uniref:hypothetical protein n=1 Tax=Microseira sp. BLCC-F43 TaxID=3153602 RepID=UPI0035B79854
MTNERDNAFPHAAASRCNVQISNASLMAQVLQWHENGLDFADALHLAPSQNCSAIYTFDDKFVKRAKELTDYEVKQP